MAWHIPGYHVSMAGPPRMGLEERLWSKITKTDSCWLWTGMTNDQGYGLIWMYEDGKRVHRRAHRVVYELLIGPAAELDHLCRVRHCVNPEHLEHVTHLVNVHRGVGPTAVNARKETCDQGHQLTVVAKRGDRGCRICINARRRHRSTIGDRFPEP